ncbi:mRNA-decapping enzyme 1B-like [Clavelina lepadiformis]|uniref:5'-(N(7)-methylguanosine 5'-triphospho)-[mRNA] hydrolase n=1 Tax=Clavelina lepadiformis TaxID=159417 RepID=A0ABP0EV15_CLALP
MESNIEMLINLNALLADIPHISNILGYANQVAVYRLDEESEEWEYLEMKGTLFVYSRSYPFKPGHVIINKLSPKDLTEPNTPSAEMIAEHCFLTYKYYGSTYGLMFQDYFDCICMGNLLKDVWKELENPPDFPCSTYSSSESSDDEELSDVASEENMA